jgi:DsbC/DsbD-like thiol-disulfide interchange protein
MTSASVARALSAVLVTAPMFLASVADAQAPEPAWLKRPVRVSAEASLEPPKKATRAGTAVLAVDVTPAPGIHVYAPGNRDYIPVELTVSAPRGIKAGAPEYPPSQTIVFGESKEVVRVYARPFRIRVPLTISADAGPTGVPASLRVQACTDKVCFPPETLPLNVAIPAAGPSPKAR